MNVACVSCQILYVLCISSIQLSNCIKGTNHKHVLRGGVFVQLLYFDQEGNSGLSLSLQVKYYLLLVSVTEIHKSGFRSI